MIGSIILFLAGCLVSAGALWFRFVRERFGLSVVLTTIANIAFVASILFLSGAARAAELPGPAAMAPVTAAPFARPWWLDLVSALLPDLIQFGVVAVLGAYGWVLQRSAKLKKLQADAETRAYLVDGGQRAIDLAYRTAGVVPGVSLTEVQLTRILGEAADYMLSRFPDGLRRFGISDVAPLRDFVAALQAQAEMRARTGLSSASASGGSLSLSVVAPPEAVAKVKERLAEQPRDARSAIADLDRLAAAARGAPMPNDPVTGLYREADGPRA